MVRYIIVLGCFWANALFAQTSLSKAKIDSIENIIRREMSKQHIPGLSIAISIDTVIVWKNAYGFSDLENFVPVTNETKFRSASVGKPMTATAVMQLEEKKLLSLTDLLQKYYPSFPEKKWPVNIYHLLTQQSGLRPYTNEESVNTRHYNTISESFWIFEKDSLLFKPGTRFSYTSFNYNMLGQVIQGASGKTFAAYMQEHIFGPANMQNTIIDDHYAIIPNRARGYRYDAEKGSIINAHLHDPSDRIPAGGFLTTAHDLVRFAISVYSGKIIGTKTFARMINNPKLADGTFGTYGFGWGCFEPDDTFYEYTEVFHGGQTPGVSNMLVLFISPGKNMSIAIMTNREGMEKRGEICEEIGQILLGKRKTTKP
jgi:serine beta-lactamase-like protein LACTB